MRKLQLADKPMWREKASSQWKCTCCNVFARVHFLISFHLETYCIFLFTRVKYKISILRHPKCEFDTQTFEYKMKTPFVTSCDRLQSKDNGWEIFQFSLFKWAQNRCIHSSQLYQKIYYSLHHIQPINFEILSIQSMRMWLWL